MKSVYFIAVLLMVFVVVSSAQQRPLLTDDVDITPSGSLNISVGVDFIQNAKFPVSGLKGELTRVGVINTRVGLAPNVELQIEGSLQNFLAISSQGTSAIPLTNSSNSTSDVGDFTVSTKIKLSNETRVLPAIGVKLGFQIPNTDQARGISLNQINIFGNVLLQKKFGKKQKGDHAANIFGNLGIGIFPAPTRTFTQNDMFLYGLAGVFRVNRRVNLVSEINGRLNTRKGAVILGTESLSQFRIGTQIKASGLRFDTAAIVGLTRNSPRTGVTFGVTYQSPNIFKPVQ
jgi:hypothetical protein